MDGRVALMPGTRLSFVNSVGGAVSYVIQRETGRGGSCIVYDASYTDNLGNAKLVRIKECCPHSLSLTRQADGSLTAGAKDAQAFEEHKARLIDAYRQNNALFCSGALANFVSNTSDIYTAYGTVYVVSSWSDSETLADHAPGSLRECALLMASVGRILERIHAAGCLYLDLKPENILVLRGTADMVQLFDFDSMIPLDALRAADPGDIRISYSRGFAPLEQQTGRLKKLGPHSDVFSLGAVLFHMLCGRTPGAADCAPDAAYELDAMAFSARRYPDRLYRALESFLHNTLASYPADRYQSMREAVAQLELIARLSDEATPRLCSTPFDAPAWFTGREEELARLSALLRDPDRHVFCLSGPGGIGKSTLARQALAQQRDAFDAVLFLSDERPLEELLVDDRLVRLQGVERLREEPAEEYRARKMEALERLSPGTRILLVLDDLHLEHLDGLQTVRRLGWRVLLISRQDPPEGYCPIVRLGELDEGALRALFAHYARLRPADEAEEEACRALLASVGGHTLLVELLARQIAENYLSLPQAARLAASAGFSHMAPGSVCYVRDDAVLRQPMEQILGRLVSLDGLPRQERGYMKLLSLFDAPGIEAGLFRELSGLEDASPLRHLEACGWLRAEKRMLSLHPVLREYVSGWPWRGRNGFLPQAEAFLEALSRRVLPRGTRLDADKQFPRSYQPLGELLALARQAVERLGVPCRASQQLRFRLLMDGPVDQDRELLRGLEQLQRDPEYLDGESQLRLTAQIALLRHRLLDTEGALSAMEDMHDLLREHPSRYYSSVYHDVLATLLHDEDPEGNLEVCLLHQLEAIDCARRSRHRDARAQLATCLLDRATTLLDLDLEPEEAGRLLEQAERLVKRMRETDYARYQYHCVAAMYHVRVTGDEDRARRLLDEATRIADISRDSTMAFADHLLDQAAPILFYMRRGDEALATVREAIRLCDEYPDVRAYRAKRFHATLLQALLLEKMGQTRQAARLYQQIDDSRDTAPYPPEEDPLCPEDLKGTIRELMGEG